MYKYVLKYMCEGVPLDNPVQAGDAGPCNAQSNVDHAWSGGGARTRYFQKGSMSHTTDYASLPSSRSEENFFPEHPEEA